MSCKSARHTRVSQVAQKSPTGVSSTSATTPRMSFKSVLEECQVSSSKHSNIIQQDLAVCACTRVFIRARGLHHFILFWAFAPALLAAQRSPRLVGRPAVHFQPGLTSHLKERIRSKLIQAFKLNIDNIMNHTAKITPHFHMQFAFIQTISVLTSDRIQTRTWRRATDGCPSSSRERHWSPKLADWMVNFTFAWY